MKEFSKNCKCGGTKIIENTWTLACPAQSEWQCNKCGIIGEVILGDRIRPVEDNVVRMDAGIYKYYERN